MLASAGETVVGQYHFSYLRAMRSIGLDLRKAMKAKQREVIASEPISLETDVAPAVKLDEMEQDGKKLGMVFLTVGFIDMVRNVAHAKAIDAIEKGYFDKYVQILGQESGEKELKPLPNIDDPKYWTDAVLNDQQTYLRQMVGLVVATKLSHHFLGQFKKYESKILDAQGTRTPINNILTPQEFEEALKVGTRLSLETGLGIDGVKALFDSIDKMPKRPTWTTFFLPSAAKVKALKKEMEKIEKKFFTGEE